MTHGEMTTDGELCLLAFFAAELSMRELRNVSAVVAEVCLPKALFVSCGEGCEAENQEARQDRKFRIMYIMSNYEIGTFDLLSAWLFPCPSAANLHPLALPSF
ncbi:MAG: hypothetical protein WAM90_01850 [Rhodanobacter sp.]